MSFTGNFVRGVFSVLAVTASPQLYRYPYRTSAEGLRGDMARVGEDIEAVMGRLREAAERSGESNHGG